MKGLYLPASELRAEVAIKQVTNVLSKPRDSFLVVSSCLLCDAFFPPTIVICSNRKPLKCIKIIKKIPTFDYLHLNFHRSHAVDRLMACARPLTFISAELFPLFPLLLAQPRGCHVTLLSVWRNNRRCRPLQVVLMLNITRWN